MWNRLMVWAGIAIAGVIIWGCSNDKTTESATDTTPPQVVTTFPADGDTGVGVTVHLQIGFSENMTVSTLTGQTIYLDNVGGSTVQASTRSATLIPAQDLEYNHEYTATVTTGVRDAAGNRLAQNYVWHFTTVSDTTRPIVFVTEPADGAIDVPTSVAIRVLMSKPIDPATVTTASFSLSGGVLGAVETRRDTLLFIPEDTLMSRQTYTVTLTTDITDTLGNALAADYSWSFTTGPESIPPTVGAVEPSDGAVDIATDAVIRAIMSEPIDPASVTTSTFFLSDGVSGTVEVHQDTLFFVPDAALSGNQAYTATLTTGITDVAGNALTADYSWTFTTGMAPFVMPLSVGNEWEYSVYEADTIPGVGHGYFDTLTIISDTIINDERWFVGNSGMNFINRADGLYEKVGTRSEFRAAAWPGQLQDVGYFYSHYIHLAFQANLTNLDTTITVPAGTFNCQLYYGFDFVERYWAAYTSGVGLIWSKEVYLVNGKAYVRTVQLVAYDAGGVARWGIYPEYSGYAVERI